MAYVVINGTPVEIQSASAPRSRARIGEVIEMFGGNLRSTVRGRRRQWGPWDTAPLTIAEADALIALIGLGICTVSGDAIGITAFASAIEADIEITGERDIKNPTQPEDFSRILTLVIRETLA